MSALSWLSLCNCWQIRWTSLLTNRTGRAGDRSLVHQRAKNQPNILDKFGSLFLVSCLAHFLLPSPISLQQKQRWRVCTLAGCWRSLWPRITQHENSVHKISSRALCIRRQGKMSHSAELRGERWNRKNWNGTSIPLYLLLFCSRHIWECHNQLAWSKDYLGRK